MSDAPCPVCADGHWVSVGCRPRLARCTGCGLLRTDPPPSADELTRAHQDAEAWKGRGCGAAHHSLPPAWKTRVLAQVAAATAQRGAVGAAKRMLLHPLAAHFRGLPSRPPRGTLLDVGSGTGLALAVLQRAGWRVTGIEMDPRAAVSRPGLPVITGNLATIAIPAQSMEIVRAWHVLEHVPDPLQTLQRLREWLAPGGELILGVPNIRSVMRWGFGPRWAGWQSSYHVYHFTPITIGRLVTRAGFSGVRIRCASVGTALDSLMAGWGPVGRGLATNPAVRLLSIYVDLGLDLCGVGDGLEIRATR